MSRFRITASEDNKFIARYAAAALGGVPHVVEYSHSTNDLSVGVLQCGDRPVSGVTAYSTVKLSDYALFENSKEFPVRIELCAAAVTSCSVYPNILATACFITIQTRRVLRPGSLIENIVSEYIENATLPHLYLTSPFLWERELRSIVLPSGNVVAWLLALPISRAEAKLLEREGALVFESMLESHNVDFFDFARVSIV